MRSFRRAAFFAGALASLRTFAAAAEECTQPGNPIETDRPDTTNSSIVVPAGSLQNTNSRWRLGIAPCVEVVFDLANYVGTLRGTGASGFGDVVPAVKWQVSALPDRFGLSITVGAALPTGANAIAGPGVQPYVQFPWAFEVGGDWAITGMETNLFIPSSSTVTFTNQSTLVIEKRSRNVHFFSLSMSATIRFMAAPVTCSIRAAASALPTTSKSTSTSDSG